MSNKKGDNEATEFLFPKNSCYHDKDFFPVDDDCSVWTCDSATNVCGVAVGFCL